MFAATLTAVTLLVVATAASLSLNFSNFSNVRGLKLNGTAAKTGNVIRLVETTDSVGTVFTRRTVIDPAKSFKTQFRLRMQDGSFPPGDGMAFSIHREGRGALGFGGGGMGYGGFDPSIAIEFDIFDNGGEPNPIENHVGLMLNGNTGDHVASGDPGFALASSTTHVWIRYAARSKRFKVWVNDAPNRPPSALISRRQNLKQLLGGKARAGFTAAGGGASITADVLSWKLSQRR
mgnify:CR=1 FL=1